MLIAGDLSGIQDYLFDVAEHNRGQSRRLRARSFYLQMTTEIAAIRLLNAAGWETLPRNGELRLSAAGKFLLEGATLSPERRSTVQEEVNTITKDLLQTSGMRLRLSLAFSDSDSPPLKQYQSVMKALQREKLRPASAALIQDQQWNQDALALDALSPPCAICKRVTATQEMDSEDGVQKVCFTCYQDYEMGKRLPDSSWLTLHPQANQKFEIASMGVALHNHEPTTGAYLYSLSGKVPAQRHNIPVLQRRLARNTPSLDFDEIADKAQGAPYLGVLKMDADNLGKTINDLLATATDFTTLKQLSDNLDDFFAAQIDGELRKEKWKNIYTVFSGGDDLLLVGAWNTLFDFAYHVQTLFRQRFKKYNLTISAGMAIAPKKTPVVQMTRQAEKLLEYAKHAGKDRFATLGQAWEWKEHDGIALWTRNLVNWVSQDVAERGWLQTLLRLVEASETEPLSAARLNYHVERNYPKANDRDSEKSALRGWIDMVIRDFESKGEAKTRYLPTILRYALLATRSRNGGEE